MLIMRMRKMKRHGEKCQLGKFNENMPLLWLASKRDAIRRLCRRDGVYCTIPADVTIYCATNPTGFSHFAASPRLPRPLLCVFCESAARVDFAAVADVYINLVIAGRVSGARVVMLKACLLLTPRRLCFTNADDNDASFSSSLAATAAAAPGEQAFARWRACTMF